MTTVATLDTVMRLNSTAFRQGMVEAAAQANRSLGSIQKQAAETASVLLQLKRAAGAAGSLYLVKEGFDGLVDAQKQLQAIHYTFQAATGSATAAAQAMGFVRKEAADIGLVLPDSAEGFAKLSASATAAGVSMQQQTELFDAYAKASTTLHLSTTQSNRALLALEQMFAKGKIQAQELRLQLGQAVPGAAARFQNAVMQMTKGTDLAGKSFDQLLEAGALTTSKFLPALVTALQGSARGWEDASHGLQAELNRLQTAWFNLKSEVSGGLFNDAVTAGARTLANNLGLVANAISAVGAGTLARVVGGTLASGASKAQRLEQEFRGSRMAATAEREYAEAQMAVARTAQAEAAEEVRKAEVVLTSTKSVQGQAQATRDLAKANYEAAVSAKAKADADVGRLGNAMTLPANIKYEQAMRAASAEAQAVLVKAERQYNAALAAGNATREQALVLQSNLNKARIDAVAAADALAAAEARLAAMREAEIAANSMAAAVGRAAKSFGSFALSLVGGPWGAAVLAIGGLAYAYYRVQKASEEYRAETQEQAKSLHDLTEQVNAAAAGYGKLHDAMNLSQGVESFTGSSEELHKRKAELVDLRDEAQKLQDAINSRAQNPNAGTALLDWFDKRKLDGINERIATLEMALRPAEQAVGDFAGKLGYGLTPSLEAVKEAIDRLKAGGGLRDVWDGLTAGFDAGVQKLNDAKAKVEELSNDFNTRVKSASKDLETRGKSQYEIGVRLQQQAVEQIRAQTNLTKAQQDQQIAALKAEQAQGLLTLKQDDAARAAKGAGEAARAQAEEYKSLQARINSRIEQDKEAASQVDKLTAAQRLQIEIEEQFKQGKTKLSQAEQDHIRVMLAAAVAQGATTRATEIQNDADRRALDLKRQLTEQLEQQARTNARQLEGMGHGQVWNQQQQAIEQIEDAYRQARVAEDRWYEHSVAEKGASAILDQQHAENLGKITGAEHEAILAQRQFYAEQKTLQGDWSLGVQAAYEDYVDAASNAYAQAQEVATNAFQSSEDALVDLVTTGKADFKSLVTSILKDLARMELRIAASKILMAFFGGAVGASSGAPVDSWNSGGVDYGSYGSSGMSGYSLAGGRASGGPVGPGRLYEVAEGNRPELLTSAGRTYLMMGKDGGHVTPSSAGGAPGGVAMGDVKVEVTVIQQGDGTTQTKTDVDAYTRFGKQMGEQMKAVAQEQILRATQPNGLIDKKLKARV